MAKGAEKHCACGQPATTVMNYGTNDIVDARNFWCDQHATQPQALPVLAAHPIANTSDWLTPDEQRTEGQG